MSLILENKNIKGIVFTPDYVAAVMAKILLQFNPESVIDICAGYGSLLEAVSKINPNIKLYGIELEEELVNIADPNLNIKLGDSLSEHTYDEYDGAILNPPYTKNYNGLEFVKKALFLLRRGKICIVIVPVNTARGHNTMKEILAGHRLLCSVKMPVDLFYPNASVATVIYLFQSYIPHDFNNDKVKFIDFSNDGYKRTKRKTASLKNTDNADARYELLPELVMGNTPAIHNEARKDEEIYIEGLATPECNNLIIDAHRKIDTTPTEEDFRRVVWDYMEWEVKQYLDEAKENFIYGDKK